MDNAVTADFLQLFVHGQKKGLSVLSCTVADLKDASMVRRNRQSQTFVVIVRIGDLLSESTDVSENCVGPLRSSEGNEGGRPGSEADRRQTRIAEREE